MSLEKKYIFRITHIENVKHIIQYGITHLNSPNKNEEYVVIGDHSLINNRNTFPAIDGKLLGEYIPFYFGARMPMLYVIQNGFNAVAASNAENIVYCVSSVQKVIDFKIPFIFTDGHAVDNFTTFYRSDQIENVDKILDFDAIKAKYWKLENDLDFKRRKEAEFLIESDLPFEGILGWVVYNQHAKQLLAGLGIDAEKIVVNQNYYF